MKLVVILCGSVAVFVSFLVVSWQMNAVEQFHDCARTGLCNFSLSRYFAVQGSASLRAVPINGPFSVQLFFVSSCVEEASVSLKSLRKS